MVIPDIFITTVCAVVMISFISSLIGCSLTLLLPISLRNDAQKYLSPILGIAVVVIVSTLVCKAVPIGGGMVAPLTAFLLITFALLVNVTNLKDILIFSSRFSVFALVCGLSILVPLLLYGAQNIFNDAFTYLAHSQWLQSHPFSTVISADSTSPLSTQVKLYQLEGFRMGASYLLAFYQALFSIEAPLEIYPAVVIVSISACSLSLGLLLPKLKKFSINLQLLLLTLPCLTLGGVVFGANLGFLPQSVGVSLSTSFVLILGLALLDSSKSEYSYSKLLQVSLLLSVLLSSATLAYSEQLPFMLATSLASILFIGLKFKRWKSMLTILLFSLLLTVLILNVEIYRTYQALMTQSGIVVGAAVDWKAIGFFAHAIGIHGGAWDLMQWSKGDVNSLSFAVGLGLLLVICYIIWASRREIYAYISEGNLFPVAFILALYTLGGLYFRFYVESPFEVGVGQSWSQFKLADWAHPFVSLIVISAILSLVRRRLHFVGIFALLLLSSALTSFYRIQPLVKYFGYVHPSDLNRDLKAIKVLVEQNCNISNSVYLNLTGSNHKLRQTLLLYLEGRIVKSDWSDDVYIYPLLPESTVTQFPQPGDCIIEHIGGDTLIQNAYKVGNIKVGLYDSDIIARLDYVDGAFERESDATNWWHWVPKSILFKVTPLTKLSGHNRFNFRFNYLSAVPQTLSIIIREATGKELKWNLDVTPGKWQTFSESFEARIDNIQEVSIVGDGEAIRLGETDPRKASWQLRNAEVIMENREQGSIK